MKRLLIACCAVAICSGCVVRRRSEVHAGTIVRHPDGTRTALRGKTLEQERIWIWEGDFWQKPGR